jgi:6-phosphogluconolactonase
MAFPHPPGAPWCALVPLLLLVPAAAFAAPPGGAAANGKWWVYVGTYTQKDSKGIYRFDFDPASGKPTGRALAGEARNPSFLALSPDHRFLYAVSETDDFEGKKTGAVAAFAVDAQTGDLKALNNEPSGGTGPCHLVVDRAGKHVLAANYGSGSVCVLPIESDGRLGKATSFIQHKGSSVNKARQEGPHAHCVTLDAANRFAFVCDLGLDKIMIYRYDTERGTLTPNDPPSASVAPGSGPRHFAFSPDGRYGYLTNEMTCTVTAFAYDAERGALKELQTVATLPGEVKPAYSTAEIEVHPSGKFLYDSNRGYDTVAVFRIDPKTAELTRTQEQGDQVKVPRNFAIDPTGQYVLVANQDSDSIVVFRIDPKTGELTPTGTRVDVPIPVCVTFMPAKP